MHENMIKLIYTENLEFENMFNLIFEDFGRVS